MKKLALLLLLVPSCASAALNTRPIHYTLCATAALNIWYHCGLNHERRLLDGRTRQLQEHLFLESNEPQQQRKNLIYQLQQIQYQRNQTELYTTLSTIGLALHIFYAGYHLGNRLLQSSPTPE